MKYSEYSTKGTGHGSARMNTKRAEEPQVSKGKSDRAFYTAMLVSEECLCGKTKLRSNSFCYSCYKSLPVEMQRALYRGLGRGYEQAVDAATVWLRRNVW